MTVTTAPSRSHPSQRRKEENAYCDEKTRSVNGMLRQGERTALAKSCTQSLACFFHNPIPLKEHEGEDRPAIQDHHQEHQLSNIQLG